MNKQGILTILGVVFSLIIAFFGWMLTNMLLDRQDIELLASTGSISVPIGQNNEAKTGLTITGAKLDKNSIISMSEILNNWDNSRGYTRPHEPVEGQLNMEQALAMAEAGVSYFGTQGIFHEELLQDEFTQISASLCVNQPRAIQAAVLSPVAELSPEYSYWEISLGNEKINVNLRINAVTGMIWDIEIYSIKEEIQLTSFNAIEMLDVYTEYLGLEGEDSVRYNEGFATKGFLGNVLQATAIIRGDTKHRGMEYIFLSISASGRVPQK